MCLLLDSALEKATFLFALDRAQGSQNLESEPGQQPKSLRIVRVDWALTDLTALQRLSPQGPLNRALGVSDCAASGQPRGPPLSPKTKPSPFP